MHPLRKRRSTTLNAADLTSKRLVALGMPLEATNGWAPPLKGASVVTAANNVALSCDFLLKCVNHVDFSIFSLYLDCDEGSR